MTHKQKGWIITILIIVVTLLTAWGSLSHAEAKDSGWDFYFFGINYKDFEGRDWKPVVVGAVASIAAHELGHIVAGEIMGMDPYFDWSDRVVYVDWDDASDDQKAMFAGAGFISQALVGTVLTAIPTTRHSDFTLGFNSGTMLTGFSYGITGGLGDENNSDVYNLTDNGYNGRVAAFITGGYGGALSYINLNKNKEEVNGSSSLSYLQTTKYDRD